MVPLRSYQENGLRIMGNPMETFTESSILVVDDSRPFLMLMGKMLNSGGYHNLHFAISAREAFALLGMEGALAHDALGVDLILMDVMMPEIDGIEACRRIKAQPHLADVPVVMVTYKDEVGALEEAFAAGAADYVIKPLSQVEILARVQAILRLTKEVERRKDQEQELLEMTVQLEGARRALRQLDLTDVLTGLGNRRHLGMVLEVEWRRGMREALPLALIYADVDDFKGYNETKGYPQGDACLKLLADVLRSVLNRAGDTAVRYNGEEFAVLLPNTDLTGALALAEELRNRIAGLAIDYVRGPEGFLSLCMGVAVSVPLSGTSHHQLLAAADEALTMAKESGPGQIKVAEVS